MSTVSQTTYLRGVDVEVGAMNNDTDGEVDLYLGAEVAAVVGFALFKTILSGTPAEMIDFARRVSLAVESATHQPGDDQ